MGVRHGSGVAGMSRPVLRPGVRAVRRDDAHLQLGLDDPDRLVLADRPGLRDALNHLDRPTPADLSGVLGRLVAEGWIIEGTRAATEQRPARPPVALCAPPALTEPVHRACLVAGLEPAEPAPGVTRLVVSLGEPRRTLADGLMRDDVPHVWCAALPGAVRIGPFVEPGRTACLRCVDAHLGDRDPRRARVLHQLEQNPPPPHPVDQGLFALAAAWVVRDVVRALDGGVPSLRSATVTVTDDLAVTRSDWLRHPHCGCAWG
jgi:hypothetical protein